MSDEARIFWCWRHGASANTDICDRPEMNNTCLITEAVVRQLWHTQSLRPLASNATDVTTVRLVEAVLLLLSEQPEWNKRISQALFDAAEASGHLEEARTPGR